LGEAAGVSSVWVARKPLPDRCGPCPAGLLTRGIGINEYRYGIEE